MTEPEYTTHSIETDSTTNRLSYEVKRPLKLSLPFSREFEVNLFNLNIQNHFSDHSRPSWIENLTSRTVNSIEIAVKILLAHFSSQIDKVTHTPKAFTHTVGLARSPSQFFVHFVRRKRNISFREHFQFRRNRLRLFEWYKVLKVLPRHNVCGREGRFARRLATIRLELSF